MRPYVVVFLAGMLLVGCSPGDVTASRPGGGMPSPAPSVEASIGAEVPRDEPSLVRIDDAGRSPEDAVLALMDARGRADWAAAYSLYATPSVDFPTAQREWTEADESYEDFVVLEVRVTGADAALVRVSYRARTTPPGGASYPVVVDDPGEWWSVRRVDGLWKTGWMPRQ